MKVSFSLLLLLVSLVTCQNNSELGIKNVRYVRDPYPMMEDRSVILGMNKLLKSGDLAYGEVWKVSLRDLSPLWKWRVPGWVSELQHDEKKKYTIVRSSYNNLIGGRTIIIDNKNGKAVDTIQQKKVVLMGNRCVFVENIHTEDDSYPPFMDRNLYTKRLGDSIVQTIPFDKYTVDIFGSDKRVMILALDTDTSKGVFETKEYEMKLYSIDRKSPNVIKEIGTISKTRLYTIQDFWFINDSVVTVFGGDIVLINNGRIVYKKTVNMLRRDIQNVSVNYLCYNGSEYILQDVKSDKYYAVRDVGSEYDWVSNYNPDRKRVTHVDLPNAFSLNTQDTVYIGAIIEDDVFFINKSKAEKK